MHGKVRSFVPEKNYGFIDGDDGNSYYVHASDIRNHLNLAPGQQVEFDPFPTPKGLRARKVLPGLAPQMIYAVPDAFIMTRDHYVRGCETVAVLSRNCWGEVNDPNVAREQLKTVAIQQGANAVVSMRLEKYTKAEGCSNYQYTMHRFYGDAVIVRRIEFSLDPDRIRQSNSEMDRIRNFSQREALGASKFVKPHPLVFYPKLVFCWGAHCSRNPWPHPGRAVLQSVSIRPKFLSGPDETLASNRRHLNTGKGPM
jgi:cold shock CspA family protein